MKRNDRGFSLMLVMMVIIAMSIVGISALSMSNTEASVAGARSHRRQALAAAEAGMSHFIGNSPASMTPDTYYIGHVGTGDDAFVYLQDTASDGGSAVEPRYRVRTTDPGPRPGSLVVVAEGEVVIDGTVAARAMVSGIVFNASAASSGSTGQGQKSLGAWGTSSNLPARTDISLVDLPEP